MLREWLLLVAVAAHGADFSGTWMLNSSKSRFGQFPAPDVMLRTVRQNADGVAVSTYQKGAHGEVRSELFYRIDGTPVANGASSGAARLDGATLVIESSRVAQGARLTQRDVWSLSADGMTLTVDSEIRLPNGTFQVKQVFEKVP
jgi:hypothetical protein